MRAAVGWRDRDWGKFDEDEWESFLAAPAPAVAARIGRVRLVSSLVLAAAAISGAATFVFHKTGPRITLPKRADANAVGVRWAATDLAPATTAGRICIVTPSRGRVCATFTIGEKPADALTRQLQALGLSVRSSG